MPTTTRSACAFASLALAAMCASTRSASALDPYTPPIWQGVYAGLHGGMNWFDVTAEPGGTIGISSGQFGGHIGLNYSVGPAVIGAEGDLNFETGSYEKSANGADYDFPRVTGKGHIDLTSTGSLRARIGAPIGDKALVYATAGYAWADTEYGVNGRYGTIPISYARGMFFHGIAYGIGAEAFVTDQISLRLEALRFDYSSTPLSIERIGNTGIAINPSSDVVRAGLSWRFN